jgi:hypothetical protein
MNNNSKLATELNTVKLKQSSYFDELYNKGLNLNNDALTQRYGNDAATIFKFSFVQFELSDFQSNILASFQENFSDVEEAIEPERLKFSITAAMDNEICINRKTANGELVKIIIHEEATVAFSYISNNPENDLLEFYDEEQVDFEFMTYRFFTF